MKTESDILDLISQIKRCDLIPKRISENCETNIKNVILLARILDLYDFCYIKEDMNSLVDDHYIDNQAELAYTWLRNHISSELQNDVPMVIQSIVFAIERKESLSNQSIKRILMSFYSDLILN